MQQNSVKNGSREFQMLPHMGVCGECRFFRLWARALEVGNQMFELKCVNFKLFEEVKLQGRGNFFWLWKFPGKIAAFFHADIHILAQSDKYGK